MTTADQLCPTVAVLIVNWNGARFLPCCLDSLRKQTARGVQVVLIDNGSTDESVMLTRSGYPEVEILELGYNYGYAEANNRAAAVVNSDYLFFLNNDTHLDPYALQALVQAAESTPQGAIFAPRQCTYDGTRTLHTGLSMDLLGYPSLGKTFYADGAALFIRRGAFRALGGFDTHYFMFFEEADLCWRAWLWGYHVKSVPAAIVYHLAGGTTGVTLLDKGRHTTTQQKRRLAHRNQLATVYKNYSTPTFLILTPLLIALCFAEIAALTASGQHRVLFDSYLPAWGDLLRERHYLRAMRRRVQSGRQVSDLFIVHRMSWTLTAVRLLLDHGVPRVLPS